MVRHLVDLTRKAAHPLPPSWMERSVAGVLARLDAHQKSYAVHQAWRRRISLERYIERRILTVLRQPLHAFPSPVTGK